MVKAVIFDLDGTISDTLSTIAHYCNVALEYLGYDPIGVDNFKYFAGDGRRMLIHRTLGYYNIDTPQNYEKAKTKYDMEYEKDFIFETKPFEGIIDVLRQLRLAGIKTAVLSNKPDNVVQMLTDKMYNGLFDVCHGKMENIPVKPDPSGAFMTANELGVDPSECVFVGDTDVDIKTAKNSGMKSIGVLWGFRDEKELRQAGADFIISKSCEILEVIFKNRE